MRDLRDRLLQPHVFLLGVAMRHGLGDQVRDLVGIERLVDVVVGAVLERGDRGLDRGVAGHDDDQHVGIDLVQAPLQFDAVGAAHLDVDQGDIEGLLGHARQRFVGALGGGDLVAFFGKPLGQRIAHAQFIVDDQQFAFASFLYLILPLAACGRRRWPVAGFWLSTGSRIRECRSLPHDGVHLDAARRGARRCSG